MGISGPGSCVFTLFKTIQWTLFVHPPPCIVSITPLTLYLESFASQEVCRRELCNDERFTAPFRSPDGKMWKGVRMMCPNCRSNAHTRPVEKWSQKVCGFIVHNLVFAQLPAFPLHKINTTRTSFS